ncbi:hypothetical protein [Pseudomonas syringae]|uniref:hypothetical protein n=1 Tax=Pseudomonas syringae TaxID=317 RepID=UPI0024616FF4|nr:hypothetical protein [Pseudomonas syringae]MDH4602489.1 hypothetical protein [Pseudomonas syringae pv. papulans]
MTPLHMQRIAPKPDHLACWERHGFELRMIDGGSHYLTRHFLNFTFVVRQATLGNTPLDPTAQYKLQFKPREGGKLSNEVRLANGLADLVSKVHCWHTELNASTISPTTPCSQRLIVDFGRRMRSDSRPLLGSVRG